MENKQHYINQNYRNSRCDCMDCNGYYYVYQDTASLYAGSVIVNDYRCLYACLRWIF